MSNEADCRYSVEELATRASVTRRTVRYYIQRGLLPPPLGLGRGKHYTEAHLDCLIRIRELQEASVPLEAVASRLQGSPPQPDVAAAPVQTTWTRVALTEDIELHLKGRRLTDAQIDELTVMLHQMVGKNEV